MDRRKRALQRAEALLRRTDCHALAIEMGVLLPLPLWQERDLWALLEGDVCRAAQLPGPVDFPALRMQARGRTLDEVYEHLSVRIIGADVRGVARRERALRLHLPVAMHDVQALLHLAKSLDKRTILYAMGTPLLTNEEVRTMLEDRALPLPDALYIDHWTGDLFQEGTLTLSQEQARASWRHIVVPSPVEVLACGMRRAPSSLGMRTLQSVVALHPSVPVARAEAYGAAGMYLLTGALWLADACSRGGIERLNFLGEGAMQQAFCLVKEALHLPVATAIVPVSPRAVTPLHFASPDDLLMLPRLADASARTPRALLESFANVADMPHAVSILRAWKFQPDEVLDDEGLLRFTEVFRTQLYDGERFAAYRKAARKYLSPLFMGRCATWSEAGDLRAETAIQAITGAEITAFVPCDTGTAGQRGVLCRALLPEEGPLGVIRRYLLQGDMPACLGYSAKGPILSEQAAVPNEALRTFREQAMAFVQDVVALFGKDVGQLCVAPAEGCAAFVRWLRDAAPQRVAELAGEAALARQWRLAQLDGEEDDLITRVMRLFIRLQYARKRPFTSKKRRQ